MDVDECPACGERIGLIGRVFQWMGLPVHRCALRHIPRVGSAEFKTLQRAKCAWLRAQLDALVPPTKD